MGINAWKAFVLRVEHPYIVRKLEKSLDVGEPALHAMLSIAAANQSACFDFSTTNYSRKPHKKHLIRVIAHGIR